MKKISFFMSALALLAFVSCEENNSGLDGEEIVEDGFYVVGEATGSNEIQSAYMMAAGFNEVDKAKRDGMYEKYIALEAGKTFSLAIYEAGDITYYGAELADMDLTGLADNPSIVIQRGALQIGDNAPKMSVDSTGLYHIVLDLNKKGDLNTPLIIVAPTKWGVRGQMNGWGYTPMVASEFNKTKITYTLKDVRVENKGGFKFAYAHGWKVNMDDMGNVKAEIGLGNNSTENNLPVMSDDLVQYGKDIQVKRGIYNIELVWTLKGGNLGKNFTAKVEKTASIPLTDDPAEYSLGLIGTIGGNNWDKDIAFTYVAGTEWNYTVTGQAIAADQEFKVRTVGTWDKINLGYSDITITGDADNFVDKGGNIACKSDATYDITLTFDGEDWILNFAKK